MPELDWPQALRQVTNNLRLRIQRLESLEPEPVRVDQGHANSDLVLTTSNQDIPGTTLNLQPGLYLFTGEFDFLTGNDDLDNGETARGILDIDGVPQATEAVATLVRIAGVSRLRSNIHKTWVVTLTNNTSVATLRARKTGGTGASTVMLSDTILTAIRLVTP